MLRLKLWSRHFFGLLQSLVLLFMLSSFSAVSMASTLAAPIKADQLKESNIGAYLGLGLDLLPKELEAQLPEDVLIGQGVLISGFASDSPAPKAGVKLYDILLNYNGIPIKHPRQLINIIKKDQPQRRATLTLVRQGKILEVPVVIGSQNYPLDKDQLDYQYELQTLGYRGYSVKMLRKNYFEATIRYLAPDGVVRRRTFKGYYNQIMPEIQASADMPLPARQKLTSIIKEKKDDEDGWFGDMMPFSDGIFNF